MLSRTSCPHDVASPPLHSSNGLASQADLYDETLLTSVVGIVVVEQKKGGKERQEGGDDGHHFIITIMVVVVGVQEEFPY